MGDQTDEERYEFHRLGLKLKFAYSIVGLILGLSCIFTGLTVGLFGVVGHTSLTASLFGLTTNLNDAAPGVVVFIVGIFMVLITRFKVSEINRTTRVIPSQLEVGENIVSYKINMPKRTSTRQQNLLEISENMVRYSI